VSRLNIDIHSRSNRENPSGAGQRGKASGNCTRRPQWLRQIHHVEEHARRRIADAPHQRGSDDAIRPSRIRPPHGPKEWAREFRDQHQGWMRVAQQGVQSFVAHAMAQKVPFAMETVFSYLQEKDGVIKSKVDLITDMQAAGYFVLLIFVGLANVDLSIGRVATRVAAHSHDVPVDRLRTRFPRTQQAIRLAIRQTDASLLVDNSREPEQAFTPCRIQIGKDEIFDVRGSGAPLGVITEWLDKVCPRA
jgi:predicted ABC-type ATPase